ncbi:aminotransferase class I/II-fold pyridoxal phosphate-dependent enzyme [Solihabitans fulvus]|uniref:8-amino-7-oxononanoate synthase n=1 Tax=Solihabitans fulvus TaxID=1892852 RepID=A0A5B2WH54_9PSEU|nr:aminotransferase class I/II-fold pyridoxal phosphate-dependent enzyme [Solihabitans fulvus]KAA2250735.1 aminotransferase class I/II-fold pyridoxal phosphate-dependent enzyme [Solihabitans fulvus]
MTALQEKWSFDDFSRNSAASGLFDPPVLDGPVGPTIVQDGQKLVNFASINFLNLHADPVVRGHFLTGVDEYGLVTGGSRMTQGIARTHLEMERELCRITGRERAISFASGLLANIGFVHAMSTTVRLREGWEVHNSDAVFVLDRDSHWSLWKAAEALPGGRRLFPFRHNDPESLDLVLSRLEGRKTVVVFESVYSADGGVAPIGALLEVCERHGAVSFVDDANGFLIYGPGHRPFAEEFAAMRRADFVMVSFSKAVGLEGGAIAGPADPIRAFEVLSGTSMFTAAMQPPTAYAAARVMRMLHGEDSIVDRYLDRVADFGRHLADAGCAPHDTESYIMSVPVNDDEVATRLHHEFLTRGYLVPVFHYPAVPHGSALLRLILNAGHTQEHIDGFVSVLTELKGRFGF